MAYNGGSVNKALSQILSATGAVAGQEQVNTLSTARSRQFFIVFRGSSRIASDHVVVGIVNAGKTTIYDPQSGQKYSPGEFGPFVAYPIIFR